MRCPQKPEVHTKASEGEKNLCPSCYDGDFLKPIDRLRPLHSGGTFRAHMRGMHSFAKEFPGPVGCPYAECWMALEGGEHLLNRLRKQRGWVSMATSISATNLRQRPSWIADTQVPRSPSSPSSSFLFISNFFPFSHVSSSYFPLLSLPPFPSQIATAHTSFQTIISSFETVV